MAAERTGVLLLRIWTEELDPRLRARITLTADISSGSPPQVVAAASVEDIARVVREWLEAFLSAE